VRVSAELRAAMPQIPPKSRKGWLSRKCWYVKQRISSDALFSDGVVEQVDDTTYTDLNNANSVAVKHFVEKTAKPTSPNLHLFCAQKSAMLGELMMKLDDGDVFKGEAQVGEGLVEVWVQEGRIAGPRN
jgi:hypothetical protein